ncbi:MAG: acetate--CoA ligase family protein, partial [Desulfobacterales bacterium]|nr:acetate--CoA ligase family protein [Desulfobacterales bacterium]
VLAVDEAENRGIKLAELPEGFKEEVSALGLSPLGSVSNPMDLAAIWAEEFYKVAKLADKHDVADVILINFGDPIENGGDTLIRLADEISPGLAVAYMGGAGDELADRPKMNRARIPVFSTPERAIRAIGAAMTFGEFTRNHTAETLPQANITSSPGQSADIRLMPEPEAVSLLSEYGIDYPEHAYATSVDQALEAAENIGYPVVLKVVSPDVSHKSDAGGVRVNIDSGDALRQAWQEIETNVHACNPGAAISGMIVCAQAEPGLEMIIGTLTDPVFGPSVMVGMGGIYTEIIRDTAQRVAPVSKKEALAMLKELKGWPLLTGARGQDTLDTDTLAGMIAAVSDLATADTSINELDLNPVRVYPDRVTALDARILKR